MSFAVILMGWDLKPELNQSVTLAYQIWPSSVKWMGSGAPNFRNLFEFAVFCPFSVYNDQIEICNERSQHRFMLACYIWPWLVKGGGYRRP